MMARVSTSKFKAQPAGGLKTTFVFDIQKKHDYSNIGLTKKEHDEIQDSIQQSSRKLNKVKNLLQANQEIRKQRDVDNKKKAVDMLEQRHLAKLQEIEMVEEQKRIARELEE